MFKRILLPTDGSAASQRAVLAGVDLARETGAEVIGLTVVPPFHTLSVDPEMLETTPAHYEEHARQQAGRILAEVEQAARAAQVPYRIERANGDNPYEMIIKTARDTGCDLILMASHGRKGIKGLLLGSETQKVLVHSAIPVLVYR
ncbi:universal stress protein [Massilia sp. Mn16-1_5]|uniref:universal stress protein n=1 Tax=Massilia sp. Mn16-1_5 TaxID=2079199 RepID=UPI00109EDD5F|nr:universal stress protein [Massilia sp. Mn16-1_5]THC46671.1 universal stress protein [Massilia sp. Mn16-1_5]